MREEGKTLELIAGLKKKWFHGFVELVQKFELMINQLLYTSLYLSLPHIFFSHHLQHSVIKSM